MDGYAMFLLTKFGELVYTAQLRMELSSLKYHARKFFQFYFFNFILAPKSY